MWQAFTVLMIIWGGLWVVLKLTHHKTGYVHMFLVAALAILGVQLIAERKARYYKNSVDR
jgi:hypothetical protein